jgi:hypothetical protein
MLELLTKRAVLILVLNCLLIPSCAHYSKSARQQRAYEHYVQKNSGIHYKEQRQHKTVRIPQARPPSSDQVNTGVTDDSSQGVPSQQN